MENKPVTANTLAAVVYVTIMYAANMKISLNKFLPGLREWFEKAEPVERKLYYERNYGKTAVGDQIIDYMRNNISETTTIGGGI